MSTIKEVAKLAKVSVGTVSRFINGYTVSEKNRIKIEKAIQQLDFKINPIARSLKTNRSMTVAVLVPALANIFSMNIIEGIERFFDQYGYSLIVCDSEGDIEKEKVKLHFIKEKYVDGVIVMPTTNVGSHVYEIMGREFPIVLIDRLVDDEEFDTVVVDNVNAAYDAVEYLVINGHRQIGIITGPDNVSTSRERYKGYQRVLDDYGINIEKEYVLNGDYSIDAGYSLMKKLLQLDVPPTAVFVSNYETTIGAIMAINELGIQVPDKLSIIGFDQLELSKVIRPSLSVLAQPMAAIGEKAAEILYRRMNGDRENFPLMVRLKAQLYKGNSVKNIALSQINNFKIN
jgi:LacI family transcriptional regulator